MERITDIKIITTMEISTKDKSFTDIVSIDDNEDLKSYFARVKEKYLSVIRQYNKYKKD